ncbi:MAG: hypothetical protein AAGG09_16330 [Pseudomonadota bacterium]
MRLDQQLAETLPPGGSAWIGAALSAQVPRAPSVLPPGGGAMMSAMMQLSAAAPYFTLSDPGQLLAELQQAVSSAAYSVLPKMQALSGMNYAGLQNMALAARITLALRQKDVCPMTLAQVDMNAQYAGSSANVSAALNYAASIPQMNIPGYALPSAQLTLAQSLASLAPLSGSGMPSLSDPHLIANLKGQIKMLAAMPMPKLSIPPEMLSVLSDIDAVYEAFGPDATSPSGVASVNAMLRWAASLRLPMPPISLNLADQLSVTPTLEDVSTGMETVQSAGASLAASASMSFSPPPIMGLLEKLSTLSGLMTKSLGEGPCLTCSFPMDAVMDNIANVPVPEAPANLPF